MKKIYFLIFILSLIACIPGAFAAEGDALFSGGYATIDPSLEDNIRSIGADSTGIYYAANINTWSWSTTWRVQKRDLATGKVILWTHSFNSPSLESTMDIAMDSSGIYISGYQNDGGCNDGRWRTEKLSLVDGSYVSGFGSNGVIVSNLTSRTDRAFANFVSNGYIYIAGFYDASCSSPNDSKLRIEKRSAVDGQLDIGFGSGGVLLFNPASSSEYLTDIKVSNDGIYVLYTKDIYNIYTSPSLGLEKWSLDGKTKLWSKSRSYVAGTLAIDDASVYFSYYVPTILVPLTDVWIENLDFDGNFQWKTQKIDTYLIETDCINVYASGGDTVRKIDKQNGSILWNKTYFSGNDAWGGITLDNDNLYVGVTSGPMVMGNDNVLKIAKIEKIPGICSAAPECSDGIDNDGDTFTDYPADIGCSDATDNDERNQCSDTIDNADLEDTLADALDPGCGTPYDPMDNDETNPADPSGLSATQASCSQINLNWNDVNNETGFQIERKTGAAAYSQIATVGANSTSYQDTGLSPSTNYYYRVRAYDATSNSGYSNESNATTPACAACTFNYYCGNPICQPSDCGNSLAKLCYKQNSCGGTPIQVIPSDSDYAANCSSCGSMSCPACASPPPYIEVNP